MNEDQGNDVRAGQSADDGYWASLFNTEDAFARDTGSPPADVPPPYDWLEPPAQPAPEDSRPAALLPATPADLPLNADPWAWAQRCMDADEILELRVADYNKGGLLVFWNGIQGFVPASQLIDFPQFHIPRERHQTLVEWHNRVLRVKIIEVNQSNSRLIFSERATLVAADERIDLLKGVHRGDRLKGTITNLTDFGAFVDLGGVEGLVHISEISWSRVVHPSALLRQGQQVDVLVLSVDQKAERVALSIKQLHSDPWATAEERYRPGMRVSGVIGNVTTYGAFVVLEEELEGLIHISELAEGAFMHPRDVVTTGDRVVARVLNVDARSKRIALSLRGTGGDPAATR